MSTFDEDVPPLADHVHWMGLCDCGCGTYYLALLDKDDELIAAIGFDRLGWLDFVANALGSLNEESDETVDERHTAH